MKDSVLEPIAITGATGFIGSHLVRALGSAGCRPIVLLGFDRKHLTPAKLAILEGFDSAAVDLGNKDSICNVLKKSRISTLFHLAGTRGHRDPRGSSAACMELNYYATARVLDAAMKAGVRRIVIAGSAEEYGNQSGPLQESLAARATTPYGISKAMATNYAREMHQQNGCPVVVVRPFSVYGPGQPGQMFVAEAVDCAVRNIEFKMSEGDQRRDLVFVEDVVRGLISAASAANIEGQAINVGTGQAHRLRDVAELIWNIAGANAQLLRVGARPAPEEELYDTWADITLARRLLEWQPQVTLEEGLQQTIDFAKERSGTKVQKCRVM